MAVVPAYSNKWPRWTNYWFYHHVCSDEDVAEAMTNDLPKAHVLVSEMTPMKGYRLVTLRTDGPDDVAAADALALISCWQISRDLVEEWVACNSPPLSSETCFFEFERRDRYVYPNHGAARSDAYSTDFCFVNQIEHKAEQIIGFYGDKEQKGKCQYLARKRRLNRVFEAMGLCYADRAGPSRSLLDEDVALRGRRTQGRHDRVKKVTAGRGANTAAL